MGAGAMSPEIKLGPERSARMLNGVGCHRDDCEGQLQWTERDGRHRLACYRCRLRVDLDTVKVKFDAYNIDMKVGGGG